jgi:hypothetical protein
MVETCKHEWKELSAEEVRKSGGIHWGSCWHVYQCVKCGEIEAQDSSD